MTSAFLRSKQWVTLKLPNSFFFFWKGWKKKKTAPAWWCVSVCECVSAHYYNEKSCSDGQKSLRSEAMSAHPTVSSWGPQLVLAWSKLLGIFGNTSTSDIRNPPGSTHRQCQPICKVTTDYKFRIKVLSFKVWFSKNILT